MLCYIHEYLLPPFPLWNSHPQIVFSVSNTSKQTHPLIILDVRQNHCHILHLHLTFDSPIHHNKCHSWPHHQTNFPYRLPGCYYVCELSTCIWKPIPLYLWWCYHCSRYWQRYDQCWWETRVTNAGEQSRWKTAATITRVQGKHRITHL